MVVSTSANSFGALQEAGEGGAPAPGKACSICGESKAESEFSKKQWVAKAHSRRCAACVESGAVATGAGKGPQGLVPVTPAPWYDEDLAPEFQGETPSMVLDPEYGHLLEQIDRGDFHPDDVIPTGVNKDTTLLQAAAAAADIPLMRAVLRRGARIDRYNGGGNALQMLCGMCRVQGDAYGQRSRFKAIEFLLTVGADPNAQPDADNGDGGSETGTYLTITPLHQAVQIRDGELSKRVCELLLQHKADPAAKHEGKTVLGSAPSKALQMTLKALINRYQSVDRPARRCPCGSERLYESCHGAKGGVPMHPRAMCGCTKPGNKTYQECCLEAGKVLFEKIPQHPPLMPASTDKVDVPHMTEDAAAAFQKEHKMQLMRSMVGPLVSRGECDSAYAYAAARSAFMVARPWRNNGVAVLPKAEMERRQRDWNALVDEYIAGAKDDEPLEPDGRENRSDLRSALEIEVAAKISWTGGPLYTSCCNPGCARVEAVPYEFALCSKCKQSRFCSKQCQLEAWKSHHKAICGSNEAEPRLPSEINVSDALCQQLLGGNGPGGPPHPMGGK